MQHTSSDKFDAQLRRPAAASWTWAALILPLAVISLLAIELAVYEAAYGEALWQLRTEGTHWRNWGYLGVAPKNLAWLILGASLILGPCIANHRAMLLSANRELPIALAAHGIAGALMVVVTNTALRGAATGPFAAIPWLVFAALPLWWASAFVMWAPRDLRATLLRERGAQLVVVIGIATLYKLTALAWDDIENAIANLLFTPTVQLASAMDLALGYKVSVNPMSRIFTVGSFEAEMAPACLGYVGIVLVLTFLGAHLYTSRKELRFPGVLLVIPMASCAIWLLNATRIAVLMVIGASWSPDIAVNGFHSAAGWVSLIVVCIGSVLAVRRFAGLSTEPSTKTALTDDEIRLVPQLVLLGISLLSMLATGSFDWLYPVRVVVVGCLLVALARRFQLERFSLNLVPVAVGLLVFAGWIIVIPDDSAKGFAFASQLLAAPTWIAIAWIVFRVLGAVVIVPIAEELAFRGFLLERVEGFFRHQMFGNARLAAAVVTSFAFGALHGSLLAGTLAGIGFAAVRYHRGRLDDAICSHAVANLCVAVYVIGGAHWSYW